MRATTLILAMLVLLPATAMAQKVNTDFDPAADFSKYKTYFWPKGDISPNSLVNDRVTAAIDGQLKAKGWQRVDDVNQADAAVVANVATKEQKSLNTFYTGGMGMWGYGGWGGMGMGSATTSVSTYTDGTMLVDIFDAKTRKLIFRASGTDSISDNPQKNAKKIVKVAEKMFKKFPPKPTT